MAGRAQIGVVLGLFGLVLGGCSDDGDANAGDETVGETADAVETGDETGGGGDGDGDNGDGDGDNGDGDGDQGGDPGPKGVFVAVGDGGRRASSNDGLAWVEIIGSGTVDTQAEEGEDDILRSVVVGDGVVIAVGGGGGDWNGNAMIMRSTDGVSWDEDIVAGVSGVDTRKLAAVGFANGVFIAAGYQSHILRSTDAGQSWTSVYGENPSRTTVFGVAGHDDRFVLVGGHQAAHDAPKLSYVHVSADAGQSFGSPSYFGQDGDQLASVASNGEVFVAVGPKRCLRSETGESWDPCGLLGSNYGAVSFTNQRFVVTYLDGVSTSSDGETWSVHVESMTGVPAEVVFGNGVYAGVRFYDRGTSEALGEWSFMTYGGFPLRDLAFLPLE